MKRITYGNPKKSIKVIGKREKTAHQRGYGYKWQQASKHFIAQEENSLCVMCLAEGYARSAEVVDHIIPHRGDMDLFWNKNNWQGLCKMHHDKKTAKEKRGVHGINSSQH